MRHLHTFKQHFALFESIQIEEIPADDYSSEAVPALPFNSEIKEDRENFLKKLVFICKKLGVNPEWMMINIHGESGFDPKATAPNGAVGLIQWVKKYIGNYLDPVSKKPLTSEDVRKMSGLEQLDMVYAYYKNMMESVGISEFQKPGDFFAITFFPAVINKPDNYVFPEWAVSANKAYFAKFGGTTKADYYNYCDKLVSDPQKAKDKLDNFDLEGFFGKISGAGDESYFASLGKEFGDLINKIFLNAPGPLDSPADQKPETFPQG